MSKEVAMKLHSSYHLVGGLDYPEEELLKGARDSAVNKRTFEFQFFKTEKCFECQLRYLLALHYPGGGTTITRGAQVT